MPTVMTHAVVGVGLGRLFTARRMPLGFWLAVGTLAMLPDLDVLAFRLGVPYEAAFGHRGFTHSLCFALLAAILAATLLAKYLTAPWPDLVGLFFVVTASHGILDAFTNGGHGVGFFLPFDDRRYFFPWRPISVSPFGQQALSGEGRSLLVSALTSELLWVCLPTVILVGLVELVRWRRRRSAPKKPAG